MSTNQRGRAEEAAEGRGGAETQDGAQVMIMMMMIMMMMMMELRQRSKDEEAERRKVNTNKIHFLIV